MISRREILRMTAALGLASAMPTLAAESPPETTRLRLHKTSSLCNSSLFVAEELLRAEGFTEIQYVGN